MNKKNRENFSNFKIIEPPSDLYERILFTIKKEQELNKARKTLFGFLFLLLISITTLPFSFNFLISQIQVSGIIYLITTAFINLDVFFALWNDFLLAILESLPVFGILFFITNLGLFLFAIRLFFNKKDYYQKYLLSKHLNLISFI
ncbi:MAG TPA: hypothetical protein PLE40_00230 [Candidatus Pacearchaeota archaeon]|nr:hypothetical protein [Candidatus Pacearchaeota archaeon]HOL90459.1 hypothetical protein [Candidatus Pacearchaeota archaeon]HPO68169.1 hypothetical protein [Candidatus Pacearchaeota archaeon]